MNNYDNIEEHKPLSSEIYRIEVRFSLSPNVPTRRIDDVDDLKFVLIQNEGKNHLSEIIMIVPTSDINEAVSKAMTKVRLLCNLISLNVNKE